MKKEKSFGKSLVLFVLIYAAAVGLFYWIVRDDWRQTAVVTDPVNRDAVLPDLNAGDEIRQDFVLAADQLNELILYVNRQPGAPAEGKLTAEILSGEELLFRQEMAYGDLAEDGQMSVSVPADALPEKGTLLTLSLRAEGMVSFWYGQTRTAGKFAVKAETSGLRMNGEPRDGELVLSQRGSLLQPYMRYYWPAAAVLFLALTAIILWCHACAVQGKANAINGGLRLISQYSYLLKTLVLRDFKVKYKASVLGVLWSFLNPLLMTFVYMFVFSTLFRNSIENFVVYLMSGIILFNYFTEASNQGMISIVGNAGLITKVYMPKYIFPISKVLSSGINLLISLIPLMIMMALTGVRLSKSLLLLPVVLLFLILFCVGVSLILSAAMVYFRDIQFLWGILLTILNFLSPIFYPESIIPAKFLTLYHMNPMYQYLFFMRSIVLNGVSPNPVTYLYCILASGIALGIGLFVFRKSQSSFVLHL
ncbi:MAG: ABC transporter permease [Clostridia bacterium]|nr:ABC transporter permease [Clostridia bacterium]